MCTGVVSSARPKQAYPLQPLAQITGSHHHQAGCGTGADRHQQGSSMVSADHVLVRTTSLPAEPDSGAYSSHTVPACQPLPRKRALAQLRLKNM